MKIIKPFTITSAFVVIAMSFVSGCVTKPKTAPQYALFPLPPDEPRIQYLTSFGAESDLGGKKDTLKDFVVGEKKIIKPIWKPYGLAARDGKLYVCDTEAKNVTVVDLAKKRFTYVRPEGMNALRMPINVAANEGGSFYVTDTVRMQALLFDRSGALQQTFGKGAEMKPCGVAVTKDRLFVTDLSNQCVRVYDKATKQMLFTVPHDPKKAQKEKLFSPTNVAIDSKGRIVVSDSGGFAVQVFDAEGNFLHSVGEQGLNLGSFTLPKGVAVDRDGRIYVVDAATAVVQIFDADGKLLMFFGDPKSSGTAGLYLPAGIAIDYEDVKHFESYAAPGHKIEYLIFVANQVGPNKVSVFGFLAAK